jgi:hypothetical protein
MICEETASECLPDARIQFSQIVQNLNPAFLPENPRDWLMKCARLKMLIFKLVLLTLEWNSVLF